MKFATSGILPGLTPNSLAGAVPALHLGISTCPSCLHLSFSSPLPLRSLRGLPAGQDLMQSIATVTEERPYQCTRCDKSYTRRDYLERHALNRAWPALHSVHFLADRQTT
jgi:hypothetical protein